jgi:hypothetical protein
LDLKVEEVAFGLRSSDREEEGWILMLDVNIMECKKVVLN